MTTKWKEINDPKELFSLDPNEWEIEVSATRAVWCHWNRTAWDARWSFRARPLPPKMKKVKMLCYLSAGRLMWIDPNTVPYREGRVRVPSEDKEIEIPE